MCVCYMCEGGLQYQKSMLGLLELEFQVSQPLWVLESTLRCSGACRAVSCFPAMHLNFVDSVKDQGSSVLLFMRMSSLLIPFTAKTVLSIWCFLSSLVKNYLAVNTWHYFRFSLLFNWSMYLFVSCVHPSTVCVLVCLCVFVF